MVLKNAGFVRSLPFPPPPFLNHHCQGGGPPLAGWYRAYGEKELWQFYRPSGGENGNFFCLRIWKKDEVYFACLLATVC